MSACFYAWSAMISLFGALIGCQLANKEASKNVLTVYQQQISQANVIN